MSSGTTRTARTTWHLALPLLLGVLALNTAPAGAWATGTLYVSDAPAETVSQYAINAAGELSALSPAAVPAGEGPIGLALSPDGKSLYVTNIQGQNVSEYNVDPQTGTLSPKTPATVPAESEPNGIAVTPNGNSVYVANEGGDSVSQYSVNSLTGSLSPKTPAAITIRAAGVNAIVVSPNGRSAYVATNYPNAIFQYDIDPSSGLLSPKTPESISVSEPEAIAVTPDGRSLYVTDADAILKYTLNPLTGALLATSPVETLLPGCGGNATMAVAPTGASLYLTNWCSHNLYQLTSSPFTDAVLSVSQWSFSTGEYAPGTIVVSPDDRSAYVSAAGSYGTAILEYSIDSRTGALFPKMTPLISPVAPPDRLVVGTFPTTVGPHEHGGCPMASGDACGPQPPRRCCCTRSWWYHGHCFSGRFSQATTPTPVLHSPAAEAAPPAQTGLTIRSATTTRRR